MHAVKQITPEVLLMLCVGGILFLVVLRAIFRQKQR
jgi:hypothetical protein